MVESGASYLNGIRIVDHPGANIGYWNLHERNMTENADGAIEVDGRKVLFVHFSGWDATKPMIVSRHVPQIESSPVWRKSAEAYSQDLLSAGMLDSRSWPYSWECYDNGQAIGVQDRRRFADQSYDGSWPMAIDPFNCPGRLSQSLRGKVWRKLLGRRFAGFKCLHGAYCFVRNLFAFGG